LITNNIIRQLTALAHGKLWWGGLIVLGISMIGIALYYQYALNEWPCVLCIHVRILFLLIIVVSVLALLLFRFRKIHALMHLVVAVIFAAMANRGWVLLGTERGWIEGECSVDVGMPGWFAIDKWLPDIFSAWTSCGYTPEIVLGITMAEIILALSLLFLISSLILFLFALRKPV
jgi:disulfide bond formation protein DsbB